MMRLRQKFPLYRYGADNTQCTVLYGGCDDATQVTSRRSRARTIWTAKACDNYPLSQKT